MTKITVHITTTEDPVRWYEEYEQPDIPTFVNIV